MRYFVRRRTWPGNLGWVASRAVYEEVDASTREVLCQHRSRKAAITSWRTKHPTASVEVWRRGRSGDVLVAEGVAPPSLVRGRRTYVALVAWILSAPVVLTFYWFVGLVMVDEGSLDLGGAGPDTFDFIDFRLVATLSIATLVVWAIALLWIVRRLNSSDDVLPDDSPTPSNGDLT